MYLSYWGQGAWVPQNELRCSLKEAEKEFEGLSSSRGSSEREDYIGAKEKGGGRRDVSFPNQLLRALTGDLCQEVEHDLLFTPWELLALLSF